MDPIGRRTAGWLPIHGMPADVTAQLWQTARHAAEDAGHDPDLLRRELRINLHPGQDARHVADSVAQPETRASMAPSWICDSPPRLWTVPCRSQRT
ncbi:MAG: hypothetical protein ACRDQU_18385 [Pseudonocardiaceae bacterium]